jgi:AI-2 transport protein TqsA
MVKFGGNLRCNFSEVRAMDVNAKFGIDSKRTTAASVAIVGVVVYLALLHLKPILMPLAIAVLLFFLIKPIEQYIHKKVGNQLVSYGSVLAAFIISMYFISIFLYEQLSLFVDEVPTIAKRFNAAFPQSSGRARKIVDDSMESISAYVVSKVTCSGGQAIVMTIIISPIGFDIPGWFLFGVLCFLLDFIPILGALFATIPPVLIGFIMLEPVSALLMLALLIGNQQMFGSLVEPNLSGAKIGISPLVLLLTVMLFSQVWGIAGAIIGAPMIIISRLILDENERTRPVAVMMANDVEEE